MSTREKRVSHLWAKAGGSCLSALPLTCRCLFCTHAPFSGMNKVSAFKQVCWLYIIANLPHHSPQSQKQLNLYLALFRVFRKPGPGRPRFGLWYLVSRHASGALELNGLLESGALELNGLLESFPAYGRCLGCKFALAQNDQRDPVTDT